MGNAGMGGDALRCQIPHPSLDATNKNPSGVLSLPLATARTGGSFGDVALGPAVLPQHLLPRCSPSTNAQCAFSNIFPQPTRSRKRKGQPSSPPSPPCPAAAPPAPRQGHQRPAAGTTPVTASPGGDHASPRKLWHRSPAPRLARQKKSPLCATIARLSPPEPPGPVPPAPGLPHALSPMKGPTVAIRVAGGKGGGEDRAAAGTPTPAPRGAWRQVWGYCPGGATGGGCLKAEPVLP